MKIIALMPVKNDAWILQTTIPQLWKFVDDILCLDGNSKDNTLEILQSYNVKVRSQEGKETNYSKWRNILLDWGRDEGGTHFIWLDSDESFTSNFINTFKNRLSEMRPGDKIAMQWLCLWKNFTVYRDDKSVWSNLYKDFIFCDDGISVFGKTQLHEGRTPNSDRKWIKIPRDEGSVLHFQFVPFRKFQVKQVFQRCREYVIGTGTARRINNKYCATLDTNDVVTKKIPKKWIDGLYIPENLGEIDDMFYKESIMEMFEEKGIEYFEPLEIWHVPEFKKLFFEKTHREPKIERYNKLLVKINNYKNKIKSLIKN